MRFFLAVILASLSSTAFAEDFYTTAPVVAATVYADLARVKRRITIDAPAGDHQIFLPVIFDGILIVPRIEISQNAMINDVNFVENRSANSRLFFSPLQEKSWENLESVKDEIEALQDKIALAKSAMDARETRRKFLSKISPPTDVIASVDDLSKMAVLVEEQTAAISLEIDQDRREIRVLENELDDATQKRDAAKREFERLSPPEDIEMMLGISVSVASASPIILEFDSFAKASWEMSYEFDLIERDTPRVRVGRRIFVGNYSGEVWSDVDLTLSTLEVETSISPYSAYSRKASIAPIVEEPPESELGSMEAPMMAAAVMVEEASSSFAGAEFDGSVIEYIHPTKVSIFDEEAWFLTLPPLSFDAETLIHAVPRSDDTAFLMARFINSSAEILLPGLANFYRNGIFIGREEIDTVPARSEATLAFGPIRGLRLSRVLERNNTGDTGFISKSNTRNQSVRLTVENLTTQPQNVRTFYALPYSEQDDLNVAYKSTPAPDEMDVDDKRGVNAWDLEIQPGETKEIALDFSLDWPEGWKLSWRP
ncbi:MAG TPA: hypothetical protein DIT67_10895 [Octadecabacter sp.]|nr:hypothetical protein [Octadecabacter sp.]